MTSILTKLFTESLDDYKYVQLSRPFIFSSSALEKYGLKSLVEVPAGFVYDFESIPWLRGANKRGGTVHDYLSRIDSDPVVTQAIAAEVYREIMEYCYSRENYGWFGWLETLKHFSGRWFKWFVVRTYPAALFFHLHKVLATPEEISGYESDPYVTIEEMKENIEKLDAKITEAKAELPAKPSKAVELTAKIDIATGSKKELEKKIEKKQSTE